MLLRLAKPSQAFSGDACESVSISRAVKAPTMQNVALALVPAPLTLLSNIVRTPTS